jgi:beta-galactosidase
MIKISKFFVSGLVLFFCITGVVENIYAQNFNRSRQKILINEGWKFYKYTAAEKADTLIYDERPEILNHNDNKVADTRATESGMVTSSARALKSWILPSANDFIKDPLKHHQRPEGNPGKDFPFVQHTFSDESWETIKLPHDWAISGPFYKEANAIVGGGMGRLPIQGIAWYRKKLAIPKEDTGKTIYLDIDGAMSYAMVWCNGFLVGGWPYGYNSFRLDLTPYLKPGQDNQLAIRLDNPTHSARWYPGSGLYRNVWLTKVNPVHVAQWGTFIKTKDISASSATVDLSVQIENKSANDQDIEVVTDVYLLDSQGIKRGKKVSSYPKVAAVAKAGLKNAVASVLIIKNPLLWGPLPAQQPNRYVAVTALYVHGEKVDEYETNFGIRDIQFDAKRGLFVNGKAVRIQGVNQHHDLGALGAAFNVKAAKRQLEMLQEMGCNAIRMAHNPPAPELLELTDQMGFLVINEVYDCWEKGKTPLDFYLIFPDWYEADIRSFIRRDKNHPSIIAWSFGNEVGEQYTNEAGATIAKKLYDIVKDEDPTRPATASMNYAKPNMPFPQMMDIISLNYQGEGIRDAPAYSHLKGIRTAPLYPEFHSKFPDKLIMSSETASTLSSRGSYIFPVTANSSAPVSDTTGGDPVNQEVSAYELYTAQFGASPDKVFASQDQHSFVSGEFVWTGWDYLGEPTPYYSARSSYSGIIDLAGFKKDRFYLYQARWKPEFPMAHILPHWNWPDRLRKVTPVHVFTSGDEAELFLNGKSLGRKKKGKLEYRLRWDDVVYAPGELRVVAYKNGKLWAENMTKTTEAASSLALTSDVEAIKSDVNDLAFVTVRVEDTNGRMVPEAKNSLKFRIEGPGEIVATDNGDPADLTAFPSHERKAFNGLCLVIIRAKQGSSGSFKLIAESEALKAGELVLKVDK